MDPLEGDRSWQDGAVIDLRSDTVTKPSPAMRQAMASADVGDDVWGDDPTVAALESEVAEILGKQAGLYVTSGTQSNLCALMAHCQRGDEYIVAQHAHTYKYEGGGAAVLGSIQPQPIEREADGTQGGGDEPALLTADHDIQLSWQPGPSPPWAGPRTGAVRRSRRTPRRDACAP